MKILVVDDDDFTTRLLQMQLRAMGLKANGYTCIELSSSGGDAIERLSAEPDAFGLVLCDLRMPAMDGVEFVRHLAAMAFKGTLVLISGAEARVLQGVEQLARQQGLDVLGSLVKPVTPANLRALLQARHAGDANAAADGNDEPTLPASPDTVALEAGILGGEIFNHYQPKVDLRTGMVVGVEALARWRHPTRGVVAPAAFVPLAEGAGLLTTLTRAVVSNSLRDGCAWAVDGRGLDVAVNVPLAILRSLDFPDRLEKLAGEAGFPLERLVLELSESRLPEDARAQLDILSRLRLKGVRLALDDFGTGFSNLAQLRDLPFSEIKIDRGFVNGMTADASRRAIVQAALVLARELGVDSVAIGVDGTADLACLRDLGCDMVQGFLVAEPMAAGDVSGWLEGWPRRRDGVLAA